MKVSKRIARKIVFPNLMATKMDNVVRNLASGSILNIMYHGVVETDSNYFSPRNIHKDQFEKQLKYLKKNFDVVSIPEAFEMISANKKPNRKTVTVSFDDGLQNNLYTALPLLEKYEVPTTFFISGVCAEEMKVKCLWAEVVESLRYFHTNKKISVLNYDFSNFVEKKSNTDIFSFLKSCDYKERDVILENLIDKYDVETYLKEIPEEVWKLMNADEVKQLSTSKFVDIGSHGHFHYNLGLINFDKAKEDLVRSKEVLENLIGKKVNMIAYPDGCYNSNVKDYAEEIGYDYQLAVNYKLDEDSSDQRILNRHGISSGTTFESNMMFLNYAFLNKAVKI